ncbi:MAG: hypothetical protein ABI920_11560 [Casimicrobiaceae bacterium]
MRSILIGVFVSAVLLGTAASAAMVTDITVFSTNEEGNYWNGLIWNTQGKDTEPVPPGRWNLYVSPDPLSVTSPTFLNSDNAPSTRVAIVLVPGDNTYSIYGEGVNTTFDPLQHFVLNLYFGGMQAAPAISGVQNLDNSNLQPAGHPNGLDIYGNSGAAEAGTLSTMIGNQLITLTAFSWITGGTRDVVWPYWANDAPYASGSGSVDYYGSFNLNVRQVPIPGSLYLVGLGLAVVTAVRRRRRAATTSV